MKLQGRTLSDGLAGDDVKLLQFELSQLRLLIPDSERSQSFFGDGTRQAVLDFQKLQRIETTGIVDEATAAEINRQVGALGKSASFLVRGSVRNPQTIQFPGLTVRAFDADLPSLSRISPRSAYWPNRRDTAMTV